MSCHGIDSNLIDQLRSFFRSFATKSITETRRRFCLWAKNARLQRQKKTGREKETHIILHSL